MCLRIKHKPGRFWKWRHRNEEVYYFKRLKVVTDDSSGELKFNVVSPYNTNFVWEPGINKANGKLNIDKYYIGGGGIHVFTLLEARYYYNTIEDSFKGYLNDYIVNVKCNLNDIIAYGNNNDAVFTEVYLSSYEYNRIIDQYKKDFKVNENIRTVTT